MTTAVLSAAGCRFTTPIAGLSVVIDEEVTNVPQFSAWGWSRWDATPKQYSTLFSITGTGGAYFWLGRDHTAFGGERGLAFYAVAGGHSLTLLPDSGAEWFHWYLEVDGDALQAWINGELVTWDTEGNPTTAWLAQTDRPGVTQVEFLIEAGYEAVGDYVGGCRAFGMGTKIGRTQGQINSLMGSRFPGLGDPLTVGCWPLITKNDLSNLVPGGDPLTLAAGTLGTDTTGPTALESSPFGAMSLFRRRRRRR